MITTDFSQYIKESMGFPYPIKPYSDLIYDKCLEYYQDWVDVQNWSNSTYPFQINYLDHDDFIEVEDFKKFPIEVVNVIFRVKVLKYIDELGFSAAVWNYAKRKHPITSYWMKSKSGLVEKSVNLKMIVELYIPKHKSLEVEKPKSIIRASINHELIHAYQFVHNTDIHTQNAWYDTINIVGTKCKKLLNNSQSFDDFFFCLYASTPMEINAWSGENLYKTPYYTDTHDFMYNIEALSEFNAKEAYEQFLKDKDINRADATDLAHSKKYGKWSRNQKRWLREGLPDKVGTFLAEEYKRQCRLYEVKKPANWILKLEGKDVLELFQYFEPFFHKAAAKIKEKSEKSRPMFHEVPKYPDNTDLKDIILMYKNMD